MKSLCFVALASLHFHPSIAAEWGDKWLKVKSGGIDRNMMVHLPPSISQIGKSDGPRALPLVLNFHPMAMDPLSWKLESNFLSSSDKEDFIVVYPEGAVAAESISAIVPGFPTNWLKGGYTWSAGACCPAATRDKIDDVQFVKDALEYLKLGGILSLSGGKIDVDPRRIYATGGSNGAFMTLRLACEVPEMFAAVVAVAAVLANQTQEEYPLHDPAWPMNSFRCAARKRPLPTMIYQGTWDPLVVWAGEPLLGFRSALDNVRVVKGLNGIADSSKGSVSYHYGHATCTAYGEAASNVTFCKMEEMGHAWPTNGAACWASKLIPGSFCETDSDASVETVNFFKRYTIPDEDLVV